jgi:hypothetical protein
MAKSGAKALSNADKAVLAQVHHLLKWKGLTASAISLAKEAKLESDSLGSYSPAAASSVFKRLSQSEDSSSESDSSSSSEEDLAPVKKATKQTKEKDVRTCTEVIVILVII